MRTGLDFGMCNPTTFNVGLEWLIWNHKMGVGLMNRVMTLLVGLALTSTLLSCSEGGGDKPPIDDRYQAVHASEVVKGIDAFLGKGYRGYQYYANPESCTLPLFELADHSVVDIQEGTHYKGRFASGETKHQFYEQFSANVSASGSYNGFSGEITGAFNDKTLNNRHNSFATAHTTHSYYRLTVSDEATLLPSVVRDLAELDPELLFEKYGTHYLKSIYIGGRVSFSSHMDRTQVTKGLQVEAAMKASYAKAVEGSASAKGVKESDIAHILRNKKIDVMGGDTALASQIINGTGEPADSYNAWASTVLDYMSIADFADGGLVPIYMLAADETRRAELETAWIAYMSDKTAGVLDGDEPLTVKKNSQFVLYSEDGQYIGEAPYDRSFDFYFPTLSYTAKKLQFDGNGDILADGHVVKIKTTEKFKDSFWTGKWSKRVYLGAFKLKHNLYYWEKSDNYNAKMNWKIEKVVPSEDKSIHFSDEIYIKNQHFETKTYLAPAKNGYLTSVVTPHIWTIKEK